MSRVNSNRKMPTRTWIAIMKNGSDPYSKYHFRIEERARHDLDILDAVEDIKNNELKEYIDEYKQNRGESF